MLDAATLPALDNCAIQRAWMKRRATQRTHVIGSVQLAHIGDEAIPGPHCVMADVARHVRRVALGFGQRVPGRFKDNLHRAKAAARGTA